MVLNALYLSEYFDFCCFTMGLSAKSFFVLTLHCKNYERQKAQYSYVNLYLPMQASMKLAWCKKKEKKKLRKKSLWLCKSKELFRVFNQVPLKLFKSDFALCFLFFFNIARKEDLAILLWAQFGCNSDLEASHYFQIDKKRGNAWQT